MNVILLAPPAAGKGTQAELLKNEYNLNHISTGNLLRDIISKGNDLGKEIKNIIDKGNLVSDEIVIEVLKDYLDNTKTTDLLLDGFPRNISQAKKLDDILKDKNSKIDYVFLFNIDREILENRITGRRICNSCGKVYNINIEKLRPKNDSICDICGNNLIKRQDDNIETYNVRYNEYLKETKPLISYYKDLNILYEIDCNNDVIDIFKQIKNIMDK